MPRKNLLSLFAEFTRFGGDLAVVQTRGYRREKLTYTDLYARVLFWNYALAGRGIFPGDRHQAELPGAPPSMVINEPVTTSLPPSFEIGSDPGDASTRNTIAEILYTSGTKIGRAHV